MTQNNRAGFTLVEMMVVIAIMGILVSLSAFGYRGWQTNVSQREAQSDLRMAATAMESAKNFGTGYPTSLPGGFKSSDKVNVSWVWGDGSKFCLRATSTRAQNINYYILNGSSSMPQSGSCPTAPFPPDEPNPSAVANSSSSVTVTWAAVSGATSYTVQSWIGTSARTTRCTGSSTSCVISSLVAGTAYNISVTASNSYGTSAEGTTSVTTQSNPVPGVTSPSVAARTASSLTISWPAVSGATCYTVRHGTGTPGSPTGCVSSGYVIGGLSASTTYNVSVVASNAAGSGTAGTTSGTTTIPAPASAGISFTGPTYIKGGDGFYYYRYNVTASGGACSIGSTQWRIGVSPNYPVASTWSGISWQASNTRTVDVSASGIYSPTDVYIFAKPQCVSGSNTAEGTEAVTTYGNPGGSI